MTLEHRTLRFGLVAGLLLAVAGAAAPALAKGEGVNIVDKTFEPATIQVAVGDTVTWTVTKSIGEPHSVTQGKSGETGTPLFDSGLETLKDDGSTFQWTFDKDGTFDYFCSVHPGMVGQVVVLAAGGEPAEPSEGGEGIPTERRLIAAGILAATLVVLFGAAWLWRRMNPA